MTYVGKRMIQIFQVIGAETRRGSSIFSIGAGKCSRCERPFEAGYAVILQMPNTRCPQTGRLCQRCFAGLSADTGALDMFTPLVAATYLRLDEKASDALHRKLKLRNTIEAVPSVGPLNTN